MPRQASRHAARYSVFCSSCLYQRSFPTRWEADVDAASHRRDNPTHAVTIVEEP
jgi:hypothetical protein